MNQFKSTLSIKFEKPIRKNSDDFDDSDLDFDSDFSSDDSKINSCKLEIDNGKPRDDIDLLKNINKKTENISNRFSNKSKKEEKNKDNDSLNELYSDKEDSEQENKINNNIENKKEEEKEKSEKNNISNGNNQENDDNDSKIKNEINKEDFETAKEREKIENELIISIQNKESSTKERIQKAEKINFKDEPDKIIITDDYGFIEKKKKKGKKNQKEEEKEQDDNNSKIKRRKSSQLLLQVNARMEKWNYIILILIINKISKNHI